MFKKMSLTWPFPTFVSYQSPCNRVLFLCFAVRKIVLFSMLHQIVLYSASCAKPCSFLRFLKHMSSTKSCYFLCFVVRQTMLLSFLRAPNRARFCVSSRTKPCSCRFFVHQIMHARFSVSSCTKRALFCVSSCCTPCPFLRSSCTNSCSFCVSSCARSCSFLRLLVRTSCSFLCFIVPNHCSFFYVRFVVHLLIVPSPKNFYKNPIL